jgi:hypothetical protein
MLNLRHSSGSIPQAALPEPWLSCHSGPERRKRIVPDRLLRVNWYFAQQPLKKTAGYSALHDIAARADRGGIGAATEAAAEQIMIALMCCAGATALFD